ncbi:unnamed protein product [Thelazia callipaeda]|uniref:T-box domain-containing protein n=1 Tax=Thelazia callipaeda TaxID=103827 RepID=A0A0N5D515_THECL|nr:unnamed protein product [Thelazia callipaeda]
MARTGEKRSIDKTHTNLPASVHFPDIPLDLAAPKRFKFMIDHLLDVGDMKKRSEGSALTPVKGVNSDEEDNTDLGDSGCSSEQLPKAFPLSGNSHMLRYVTCRLEGRELWNKFYELSTEMIITKSGR